MVITTDTTLFKVTGHGNRVHASVNAETEMPICISRLPASHHAHYLRTETNRPVDCLRCLKKIDAMRAAAAPKPAPKTAKKTAKPERTGTFHIHIDGVPEIDGRGNIMVFTTRREARQYINYRGKKIARTIVEI